MAVKPFNVMNLGKAGFFDPKELGYSDSLDIIKDESLKIQKSFVKIGWYLKHIKDNELYREGGYTDINECAADQFGYSQSTVSRFINICEKFSKEHNSPELDEKYAGFDKSQMIEMLPMEPEKLEKITPNMTVKQIREIKNSRKEKIERLGEADNAEETDFPGQTSLEADFPEYLPDPINSGLSGLQEEKYATSHKEQQKLEEDKANGIIIQDDAIGKNEIKEMPADDIVIDGSYREVNEEKSAYGLPRNEYPEGSLISTEGCGHKYDCFSCAQDCRIRQKERYCREAPLGNPFPCITMDTLDKMDEELGSKCQFINHDLAEHTPGSNEPTPCCKECDQYECIFRCERAGALNSKMQEQAERPILKNNDQRKEWLWLGTYKTWGLWYRDENIDVNYYKYDFPDGSRLVVAEYPQRYQYWNEKKEDEVFYHLLEKNKKGCGENYDEVYRHTTDSKTYLVEFLKKIQKEDKLVKSCKN